MTEAEELLEQITRKLDTLIALARIQSGEALDRLRKELRRDPVATAILELTGESLSYTALATDVARKTGAGERTVKRRISELSRQGLITSTRRGREVYYANSGLL